MDILDDYVQVFKKQLNSKTFSEICNAVSASEVFKRHGYAKIAIPSSFFQEVNLDEIHTQLHHKVVKLSNNQLIPVNLEFDKFIANRTRDKNCLVCSSDQEKLIHAVVENEMETTDVFRSINNPHINVGNLRAAFSTAPGAMDSMSTRASTDYLNLMRYIKTNAYEFHAIKCDLEVVASLANPSNSLQAVMDCCNSSCSKLYDFFNNNKAIPHASAELGMSLGLFGSNNDDMLGMNRVDFHMSGASRIWCIVPASGRVLLEHYLGKVTGIGNTTLLNHKLYVTPDLLDALQIPYTLTEQLPGDIIITAMGSLAVGFNSGLNLTLKMNILLEEWLQCFYNTVLFTYASSLNADSLDYLRVVRNIKVLHNGKASTLDIEIPRKHHSMFEQAADNVKILGNFESIIKHNRRIRSNCSSELLKFQKHYAKLFKQLDIEMRPDLLQWLSRLYQNVCSRKHLQDHSTMRTSGNGIRGDQVPLVALVNDEVSFFPNLSTLLKRFHSEDDSMRYAIKRSAEQHAKLTCSRDGRKIPKFACSVCYKSGAKSEVKKKSRKTTGCFYSQAALEKHLSKFNNTFICNEMFCKSELHNDKKQLISHIQRTHRKWTFLCPICIKNFNDINVFVDHVRLNHANSSINL